MLFPQPVKSIECSSFHSDHSSETGMAPEVNFSDITYPRMARVN